MIGWARLLAAALVVAAVAAPAGPAPPPGEDAKVWKALTEEERRESSRLRTGQAPSGLRQEARKSAPSPPPQGAKRGGSFRPTVILIVGFAVLCGALLILTAFVHRRQEKAHEQSQTADREEDVDEVERLWRNFLRRKRR